MRIVGAEWITTNDGREWVAKPEVGGGWSLYEVLEVEGAEYLEQHDSIEGDDWNHGDMVEYLKAVGG